MGTILTHLLAALGGAVLLYLVLRNNPKWKARADKVADIGEAKLKERK
jgi:hypothetical protein